MRRLNHHGVINALDFRLCVPDFHQVCFSLLPAIRFLPGTVQINIYFKRMLILSMDYVNICSKIGDILTYFLAIVLISFIVINNF